MGCRTCRSRKPCGGRTVLPGRKIRKRRRVMLELKLDEVTKKYKDNIAVNHISAAFTHGVYGLLGANGAGKTTLLRRLCDILRPDEGKILCNDRPIDKLGAGYRRYLGYLPRISAFIRTLRRSGFLCIWRPQSASCVGSKTKNAGAARHGRSGRDQQKKDQNVVRRNGAAAGNCPGHAQRSGNPDSG